MNNRKHASPQSDAPITLMNLIQSCQTLAPRQHTVLLLLPLRHGSHTSLLALFRGQQKTQHRFLHTTATDYKEHKESKEETQRTRKRKEKIGFYLVKTSFGRYFALVRGLC